MIVRLISHLPICLGFVLSSCQERTVVQGSDVSRSEQLGVLTVVSLDDDPMPDVFDFPASYRAFQIRSGATGLPHAGTEDVRAVPSAIHDDVEEGSP